MKYRSTARFALCLAVAAISGCAELGLYSPAPPRTSGRVVAAGNVGNTAVRASITVGEARRLAVANGLTGYRALPPGIARNLARGKPLPPGIARKMVPGGMLASLPRVEGHEWRITGTDLILIAIGTLIVVEVLDDVFR